MKVSHFCLHFNQSQLASQDYQAVLQLVEIFSDGQNFHRNVVQRCTGRIRRPNGLDFRSSIAGSLTSWTLLLIWGIETIWETVWECSVWSWSHLAAVARGFDWSNIWQKTAHFRHRSYAALTQKWHQPCSFWMYWEHLLNTESKSIELLNSNSNSLKKCDPSMRVLQEVENTYL